jgi:deoxyribonuclease IV
VKTGRKLLFATGGVPESSPSKDSVSALRFLRESGLDAMELEFVRGTFPGEAGSDAIARASRETGIRLTAHAPYFINLNSTEPDKVVASRARILKTASIGSRCGAESMVFHAGFFQDTVPEDAFRTIRTELARVMEEVRALGIDIDVRPETTGKPSQFGSVEEVLGLCSAIEGVHPCIDWSHLHARSGEMNDRDSFRSVLDRIEAVLGKDELGKLHMHVSGIDFGPHGEKKHLDLRESDFRYEDLLRVLREYEAGGFLVCESPHRGADALLMKNFYERL